MDMDKNVLLVKAVKKFPCLYKHDTTEYSRVAFTEPAWNEISKEIKMPVQECKEKWKNLRYGLLRSLRRTEQDSVKKRYYLHDEMKYLIPYVGTSDIDRHRKRKEQGKLEDIHDDELENPFESEAFEMNVVDSYSGDEEPIDKKPKTYEIQFNPNDQERNFLTRTIQQTLDEDPRRMFLLSLLPEIADFSEAQMKTFRRKVFRILDAINEQDPL